MFLKTDLIIIISSNYSVQNPLQTQDLLVTIY